MYQALRNHQQLLLRDLTPLLLPLQPMNKPIRAEASGVKRKVHGKTGVILGSESTRALVLGRTFGPVLVHTWLSSHPTKECLVLVPAILLLIQLPAIPGRPQATLRDLGPHHPYRRPRWNSRPMLQAGLALVAEGTWGVNQRIPRVSLLLSTFQKYIYTHIFLLDPFCSRFSLIHGSDLGVHSHTLSM